MPMKSSSSVSSRSYTHTHTHRKLCLCVRILFIVSWSSTMNLAHHHRMTVARNNYKYIYIAVREHQHRDSLATIQIAYNQDYYIIHTVTIADDDELRSLVSATHNIVEKSNLIIGEKMCKRWFFFGNLHNAHVARLGVQARSKTPESTRARFVVRLFLVLVKVSAFDLPTLVIWCACSCHFRRE